VSNTPNSSVARPCCSHLFELVQVARVLAEHVHRLAVVDPEDSNRVSGIITQTALARFVLEHRDLLGDVAGIQMVSFVKGDVPMLTCSVHATVMQAFDIMNANGRKGIGIVDGEGKLVSSISVSDVRYLYSIKTKAVHHVMEQNVMEFLKQERCSDSVAPFTVRPTDSFPTALLVVLVAECHRVYIVDDGMRPIGVFTLSDALKTVAPPSLHAK
jgi:CBS domain-containing protein